MYFLVSDRERDRQAMFSCNERLAIIVLALFSILLNTNAHKPVPCSQDFPGKTAMQCMKLTTLGAEFGWNYYTNESRFEVVFGERLFQDVKWLAWGVNPQDRPQMVGTRAIIGIKEPNGSFTMNTYNITSDTKLGCKLLPSKIDVRVRNMRSNYSVETGFSTMYATLILNTSVYNISKLNLVWQVGYHADGLEPKMHPDTLQNVDSTGTINLISGRDVAIDREHRHHWRMVHGVLNIVGWGTLLPVGVILARYFRKFPVKHEAWYVLHVSTQILGYTLGTTGWIIGISLGQVSKHYKFQTHRIFAIFIFTFTTLQMFALRLRPKESDEYRKYWDMYHHFLGYALLALISANIFQGIEILKPDNNSWKWAYIGILVGLLSVTLVFEIATWATFIFMKWKQKKNDQSKTNQVNTTQQGQDGTTGPIESAEAGQSSVPRPT